jgi:hypothetical protein
MRYYKVKTNKIEVNHYTGYVLGISINSPASASQVLEMDIYNSYPKRWTKSIIWKNHPKVLKGIAFWVNETYICVGYNIGEVYRPIFNYKREELAFSVRKDIVKYAKILVSNARHALYKKELMKLHNKKIPEVLVDYIANYAWDIMLLL